MLSKPSSRTYEKDGSNVTVYSTNKVEYYIMTNMDQTTIAWRVNNYECSILGSFTLQEAEKIIDSIYERKQSRTEKLASNLMKYGKYADDNELNSAAGFMAENQVGTGYETAKNNLNRQYDNARQNANNDALSRGMARSSFVQDRLSNLDVERSRSLSDLDISKARAIETARANILNNYQTNKDNALQNEKKEFASTINAYYNDFQQETDNVRNNNDPSDDWKIPYLQAARNEKILAEQAAALKAAKARYSGGGGGKSSGSGGDTKKLIDEFNNENASQTEISDASPYGIATDIDKLRKQGLSSAQIKASAKAAYENKQITAAQYFPWLEEFKTVEPKTGARYLNMLDESGRDEYETLKDFLSPEEYSQLSTVEKYQRALDRYAKRKKNDWEIGIEYERYIGYLYEQKGFKVIYHGALMGLEDMGRDLIAKNRDVIYVIQCKRWAKEKTIHEKHIFQLFGSTILFSMNESEECEGVFVTTTSLSDTAKKCAERLNISVREKFQFADYPMIKCNIAKDGEKIYHLPFDQQYDKVQICGKKGAQYVATVKEAEELGFRRAFRWRPQNDN